MGMLVHYSAGIYIVLLAAHFLFVGLRRMKHRVWLLATVTFCGAAILATWAAWSLAVYGRATFTSNTTVSGSEKFSSTSNLEKVFWNVFHTLVPHPIGLPYSKFAQDLAQPTLYGKVRDYCFMMYQPNLFIAMGSIGGVLVVYLLIDAVRKKKLGGFWLYFIIGAVILGPAVHGEPDLWGVTHVCLQPLVLLGLTLLASRVVGERSWFKTFFVAGIIIDTVLGVLLQFYCSSRIFHMVDPMRTYEIVIDGDTMNPTTLINYAGKVRSGWTFIGDDLPDAARRGLYALIVFLVGAMIIVMLRELGKRGEHSDKRSR
jgi:hypothetical protein